MGFHLHMTTVRIILAPNDTRHPSLCVKHSKPEHDQMLHLDLPLIEPIITPYSQLELAKRKMVRK
jgi:hypothetical protein